jgi:hypothetical protein
VVVPGTGDAGGLAGGPNGIPGDTVVDGNGTLYIPYGPGPGGGTVQRLFSSADEGASFAEHTVHTTPANATSGAIFSTVAVDSAGGLYFAWAETQGKAMRIFASRSHDQGGTWSEPLAVSPPGLSAAFPWVVAGAPGRFAVGYYAAEGSFAPDAAGKDTEWRPVVTFVLADGAGSQATTVPVTAAPSHKGPICTLGTGCSGGRELGDFFEVAMDRWGRVVVAWADDSAEAQSNHVAVQTVGSLLD